MLGDTAPQDPGMASVQCRAPQGSCLKTKSPLGRSSCQGPGLLRAAERDLAGVAPRGLTPVTLLDEALAVLEGLLPQLLLGRQQAAGGGGGRQHGQGGALQLRLVI